MIESLLISQVEPLRSKVKPGEVIGIFSTSRWQGGETVTLTQGTWRVAQCDSVLALRERLSEDASSPLIVVTPLATTEVGDDIRAPSQGTDELAQSLALETVRPDTLVSQLGVSARAQNTLDRMGVFTAQDLAAQQPGRFSSLRGVGNKTRREVMDLIGKLRLRFQCDQALL